MICTVIMIERERTRKISHTHTHIHRDVTLEVIRKCYLFRFVAVRPSLSSVVNIKCNLCFDQLPLKHRIRSDLCQQQSTSANSWTNSLSEYCVNLLCSCCDIVFVFLEGRNKIIRLYILFSSSSLEREQQDKERETKKSFSQMLSMGKESEKEREREK